MMPGAIRNKVRFSKEEKSACGMQPLAMLRMVWVQALEAEMNKSSGELNESLVEGVIGCIPAILQPEMLQHIMSLIVALGIETLEIAEVAGIEGSGCPARFQTLNKGLHALRFFHALVRKIIGPQLKEERVFPE